MMRNADDNLTTKIDFRTKHRLETPHEFPKNSIKLDKFTGFFDKSASSYIPGRSQRLWNLYNPLISCRIYVPSISTGICLPQPVIKPKADSFKPLRIPGGECRVRVGPGRRGHCCAPPPTEPSVRD